MSVILDLQKQLEEQAKVQASQAKKLVTLIKEKDDEIEQLRAQPRTSTEKLTVTGRMEHKLSSESTLEQYEQWLIY